MSEASSNTTHWAIGAILLFIGAFVVVALVLVYSQADSVDTQAQINNQNPTVSSIFISTSSGGGVNNATPLSPIAGGAKTIYVNGVVADTNGAGDINDVDIIFYRDAVTPACTADNNNCYKIDNCPLSADTATTKTYDCTVNVQFYADSTMTGGAFEAGEWKTKVIVNDKNSGTGNATTDGANDVEVNTLASLTIPSSINYGALANAQTTTNSNNQEMTLTQQGNDEVDVTVAGTIMTCNGAGSGTIGINSQKWALTDVGFASTDATVLTGTDVDTNIAIGYRTNDGADLTKILYWDITIPYGAFGTCTGTNTITTIPA